MIFELKSIVTGTTIFTGNREQLQDLIRRGSLINTNFGAQNFTGLDFSRADLTGSSFKNACLDEANLSFAILHGVDFTGGSLIRTRLDNSYCTSANFCNAKLVLACLQRSCAVKANFSKARLAGANFEDANLSYADLSQAHCEFVNFNRACMFRSDRNFIKLTGATFGGTSFDNTAAPPELCTKEYITSSQIGRLNSGDYKRIDDSRVDKVASELLEHMRKANQKDFTIKELRANFIDRNDKNAIHMALENMVEDGLAEKSKRGADQSWKLTAEGNIYDLLVPSLLL